MRFIRGVGNRIPDCFGRREKCYSEVNLATRWMVDCHSFLEGSPPRRVKRSSFWLNLLLLSWGRPSSWAVYHLKFVIFYSLLVSFLPSLTLFCALFPEPGLRKKWDPKAPSAWGEADGGRRGVPASGSLTSGGNRSLKRIESFCSSLLQGLCQKEERQINKIISYFK